MLTSSFRKLDGETDSSKGTKVHIRTECGLVPIEPALTYGSVFASFRLIVAIAL